MALRKRPVSSGGSLDGDSQRNQAGPKEDGQDGVEVSSSRLTRRERRWKEKMCNAEYMTEEEMVELAMRLSQQEASAMAMRQQQEKDAVVKAIEESKRAGETVSSGFRRKLSFTSRENPLASEDQAAADGCTSDIHQNADESLIQCKKRKRESESLPHEMPDLTQIQKILSQESLSRLCLDSSQSSDSTQVEYLQLQKSPVFPLSSRSPAVHMSRLDQDLVQTCIRSGFVLCSQDSWTSTQYSLQSRSPTFPRSGVKPRPESPEVGEREGGEEAELSDGAESNNEAELSDGAESNNEAELSDGAESNNEAEFDWTELSDESGLSIKVVKSPVFGRNTQEGRFPIASERTASEFGFSSQETSSLSVSCRPASPVFPRSPARSSRFPPLENSSLSDSPASEPTPNRSRSPVFGRTAPEQEVQSASRRSASPPEDRKGLEAESTEVGWKSDGLSTLSSNEDDVSVNSPSPVFPAEPGPSESRAGDPQTSDKRASPGLSSLPGGDQLNGTAPRMVRYYWGVPFCPRGLDPDDYTHVILTQMEVYEKSLKQAQRRLLRKAAWGEAIVPETQTSTSPRGSPDRLHSHRRRLRVRKRTEASEERANDGEEQMNSDDSDVCPETQLSNQSIHDLTMDDQTEPVPSPKSPEMPEMEMILPDEKPVEDEEENGADGPQRSTTSTTCPICQDSFPTSRIQTHAAFCDGDLAVARRRTRFYGDGTSRPSPFDDLNPSDSPRPRRKRWRREEGPGRKLEKCFICLESVPLRQYAQHTENCIRSRPGNQTRTSLLSALDQTENRSSEAGASASRALPYEIIDLRDDDNDEEAAAAFRISNSPIRSFTPISEATDCLIDFRKQQKPKRKGHE